MKKLPLFVLLCGLAITAGCITTPTASNSNTTPNQDSRPQVKQSGKALDLSGTGLEKVSQDVFAMTNLEELNVSNNNLTGALPAEIRRLQKLRILNAGNNKMTGVPAEVGQLQNLEVLDLSNNQLTGLPYELGNLQNLKTLNLSGNDYSKQDLEIIRKKLPTGVNIIL